MHSQRPAGFLISHGRLRSPAPPPPSVLDRNLARNYNTQVAVIAATRQLCQEAVSVLHIGAEKFMLIKLDKNGNYQSTKTNTSCAAGTGSFLDQQAARLNLPGIEELCEKAKRNTGDVPVIASRCAVFANTDIIHAQQRGFSVSSICNSLCFGLAENIFNTVFNREQPEFPILMTGGVSRNTVVKDYLEKRLKTTFLQHEDSCLFGAIGAALLLLEEDKPDAVKINSLEDLLLPTDNGRQYFHKPLSLSLSNYPDFSNKGSFRFKAPVSAHPSEVEVDIYSALPASANRFYAGIDIGSTSTKAILIDEAKNLWQASTPIPSANPCRLSGRCLRRLTCFAREKPDVKILGLGTTGSGRTFIGKILNADLIIDEITSHARAAYELNPLTDTIIEIGGQDAKFTLMHNGNVTFSQMNSVCAAGTGSFLQEQAKKLGCSLSDYAEMAANLNAPLASDRCAVFMERDIIQLLNNGYSANEILATALHSVTDNYLQKVATEALSEIISVSREPQPKTNHLLPPLNSGWENQYTSLNTVI